jgi:drug/metabolite transporter (DMT)-like permease
MSIIGLRALLAMLVFFVYRRSFRVHLTRGNMLAAFCIATTTILFVFSNKLTTAAAAILLQFTAPVFIILIHIFIYKYKHNAIQILTVLATLAGMILFFMEQLSGLGGLLGNLLAVLSGLTFAGVFVCNRRPDVNPDETLHLGFMINAAVGLPFVFFETTPDPAAWGAVLALGMVQVGLAYVFFSKGIKKTPALLSCLITALEPVLNPLGVALAYGEVPGVFALIGGAVIVVSVVAYNIWEARQGEPHTNL